MGASQIMREAGPEVQMEPVHFAPITPEYQREAIRLLARELAGKPFEVFSLGLTPEDPDQQSLVLGAFRGRALVGAASIAPGAMDAAAGELNVTVPARHRGAGIGSSLVQRLADAAGHLGYRGLVGRVGADNAAGRALAHRQGFEVHRTNLGFALCPTDVSALRRVVSDAGERGIEIRILHRALDQRHLLEVLMACTPGLPGLAASIGSSAVLRHFPTDASFLVVEVDGIPAGIGVVHRAGDSDAWYTDFTGVIPEFRGRGLSKVLKAAELIEVADRGGRVLETHNDDTNLGMIRVNEEFGGVPVESILVLGRGL